MMTAPRRIDDHG